MGPGGTLMRVFTLRAVCPPQGITETLDLRAARVERSHRC